MKQQLITHERQTGLTAPVTLWLFDRVLRSVIRTGTLTIRLPDGEIRSYGRGEPRSGVAIHDWRTLRRIALHPDLAVGEAFMDGGLTVDHGDLYGFLSLLIGNVGEGQTHLLRQLHRSLRVTLRRFLVYNPVGQAQKNVAHHYDLSDDLFELFLDPERQYSCGYFVTPDDSLEQAQEQKLRHIAAKLRLAPGQKVLDIGCGWGGLGLYLARVSGADVTGITLSKEQQRYAASRAEQHSTHGQAKFELRDYRLETEKYDRIVSVGMFEHVGAGHYHEFFTKLSSLLKDDGIALVHTIANVSPPDGPQPWLQKYIFPGGYIPSLSEIAPAIEQSGLILTDLENLRLHYAETLKAWRMNFMAKRAKAVDLYDERFCRMWEFYLAACEAGFRLNGLVVFQIQLAKQIDAVPMTRSYIEQEEQNLAKVTSDEQTRKFRFGWASGAEGRN